MKVGDYVLNAYDDEVQIDFFVSKISDIDGETLFLKDITHIELETRKNNKLYTEKLSTFTLDEIIVFECVNEDYDIEEFIRDYPERLI